MQYSTARGTDVGPVADNFGAACHQMDRADLMLADLRERNRHGSTHSSEQTPPDIDGPSTTILARHDPHSQITVLVLDSVSAHAVIYAIAAHADEREANLRRDRLHRQNLLEGSPARADRPIATDRDTRIAARLRAIEHEYRATIERDAVPTPPEPMGVLRVSELVSNREIELE